MIAHPSAIDLRPESDSIPLHRLSPHPPPAATILRGGRSLSLGRPPPPRATPPLFVVARLGAAQRRLRAQRGSGGGGSGHVEDLQAQRDLERLFQLADINEEAAQSSSAGGGGGGDSGGGDGDGGSSGSGSSQPRREPLQPTAPTSTRGARAPPPPPLSSPGAAPRPQKPYRSPPPPDSISMPFEAFRSSDHEECGVQVAPNRVLAGFEDDDFSEDGELSDYKTDRLRVKDDTTRDGLRDPDAVHAVLSTPPATSRRPPPPTEAPDTAWSTPRYLPARELQAREANCASPPNAPRDRGAAWTRVVQRKRVDESSASASARSAARRRNFTLRPVGGEDSTGATGWGELMPEPDVFAIRVVYEDDADALKTPSWSSSWHDVLCGGDGEGTGIDGTDELDVGGAIEGGMCCACEFIGPTRVGDVAPVEKELDDGTATDIAVTKTSRVGYATRARSPLPTPTHIAVGDAQQQQARSTVIAYTTAW